MAWLGLSLLLFVALTMAATGIAAVFVLFTAAGLGALFGVLSGTFPASLLWVLPERLLHLLQNDLLQALPLYVFMGLLLERLPLADALYRSCNALQRGSRSAPMVSGMLLGGLLGPMNGSVGASVLGLSRLVRPRLAAEGVAPAQRDALIAVASTLGVLVPPSLVLILLGSAMMTAHTTALQISGRMDRVVNTGDIFQAAQVPAALFFMIALLLAWWSGRNAPQAAPRERVRPSQWAMALATLIGLLLLLGGVAAGALRPVEAAAAGGCALLLVGLLGGHLRGRALHNLLHEAMATSGALFSLLLAATTFTLVLRLLGTDQLVQSWISALPGNGRLAVAATLAAIALCAFVLDAFEIIFVVIPLVMPPLLVKVPDVRWVSVLVLLTLQAGFLLPPFGYALMMVRNSARDAAPWRAFLRALAPFIAAQWLLLLLVLWQPRLVHLTQSAGDANVQQAPAAQLTEQDMSRLLEQGRDDGGN